MTDTATTPAQPSTPRIEAPSDGMPVWCCGDELPAMLENLAVKLREVPTITGHAHTAMAEILAHSNCNYTRELYRLAGIPTESGQ